MIFNFGLIERCPAISVNLDTKIRDVNPPYIVRDYRNRADCGIYAEVRDRSCLNPGNIVELVDVG
jgi:hypothetical protein